MGIGFGSFNNFPLLIGMFLAMTISFIIKKPGDNKSFTEKVDMFCEGGWRQNCNFDGYYLYMLAGAMHATDTVTN